MRTVALSFLLLGVLAASSAAECPTVDGVTLPCTTEAKKKEATPTPSPPSPPLPQPLFTAEQVARDTAPEFLALLNDPTWENAVRAAQVDLYRVYRAMVAIQLKEAARKSIILEVEQKTGISMRSQFVPFLQEFSRMWGLPVTDLTGIPAPTASLEPENETARLLAEALLRGQPQP